MKPLELCTAFNKSFVVGGSFRLKESSVEAAHSNNNYGNESKKTLLNARLNIRRSSHFLPHR